MRRRAKLALISIVIVLVASFDFSACAADLPLAGPSAPSAVTADPIFTQPYVDIDEWRDTPVRHRYVHGGFKGTDALFSIYFPPKEHYEGRFFQPLNPTPGNENGAQRQRANDNPAVTLDVNTIAFAIASGGYLVESNMGRKNMYPGDDHTIAGYRASAAVAQYSRVLAAQMYGAHRPYGYVFGASGGSLRTISCIENTHGVWDGAVPYVTGTDMAIPNVFAVQAHAMRLLKDKFPAIVDAIDPGGSGDMYAGLNEEQRAALLETTRMGFPPAAWFAYERLAFGYTAIFALFLDHMTRFDPQYFGDFWTVPGYLGANPPASLLQARIQHETIITEVVMSDQATKMGLPVTLSPSQLAAVPIALRMASIPKGDLNGASVILKSGAAVGHRVFIAGVRGDLLLISFGEDNFNSLNDIKAGDKVQIDNSVYLAAQTYYRHQVPSREYYVWDQFRGPDGKPKYPQRPMLLGPNRQEYAAGSIQSGRFDGKMILVQSLMDESAFPWSADWYRSKVKKVLGSRLDDNFRLWFTENALHGEPASLVEQTRVINYLGSVQQALRDLSAWVEKGVPPPTSTHYKIIDGQVVVPTTAAVRRGIQPVVALTANGGKRAEVTVGQAVNFSALVEVPPHTGTIVAADWDFEGAGTYPVAGQLSDASSSHVVVKTSYSFSKPGTYFPALRVASQRQGDANTPYARIQNLDRVRVVVREARSTEAKKQ